VALMGARHGHALIPDYIVNPVSGCWVWNKCTSPDGYGRVNRAGAQSHLAHRYYWERANGPVPDGLELDHLCRNRACVNPAHLEAVTHAENDRRGITVKLSVADVVAIRKRSSDGESRKSLAIEFGVHPTHVSKIVCGWKWASTRGHAEVG
jgi:hypothetical protein